jgi:hypothetical protein
MFGGTRQSVAINTTEPGRSVRVDGLDHCATPCIMQLSRDQIHTVIVAGDARNGRPDTTFEMTQDFRGGMLALDIIFTLGIGAIVDYATGAWHNLEPVGAACSSPTTNGCRAIFVP